VRPGLVPRLQPTEVSILSKTEEPEKLEGRVVFQAIVDEEMLNDGGHVHGGCTATIIDMHLLDNAHLCPCDLTTGHGVFGVSQSLNTVYHSPALLGDKLRIVCTTLTVGSRIFSSRCEVRFWQSHPLALSAYVWLQRYGMVRDTD
ncbi:HotDog domain-containing protein, partial [Suillus spraguei]